LVYFGLVDSDNLIAPHQEDTAARLRALEQRVDDVARELTRCAKSSPASARVDTAQPAVRDSPKPVDRPSLGPPRAVRLRDRCGVRPGP
jgi:hypothetical protein